MDDIEIGSALSKGIYKNICIRNILLSFTYANFGNDIPKITSILTMINILVLMVFMHYMRY